MSWSALYIIGGKVAAISFRGSTTDFFSGALPAGRNRARPARPGRMEAACRAAAPQDRLGRGRQSRAAWIPGPGGKPPPGRLSEAAGGFASRGPARARVLPLPRGSAPRRGLSGRGAGQGLRLRGERRRLQPIPQEMSPLPAAVSAPGLAGLEPAWPPYPSWGPAAPGGAPEKARDGCLGEEGPCAISPGARLCPPAPEGAGAVFRPAFGPGSRAGAGGMPPGR
jgi:hypothetical protein